MNLPNILEDSEHDFARSLPIAEQKSISLKKTLYQKLMLFCFSSVSIRSQKLS